MDRLPSRHHGASPVLAVARQHCQLLAPAAAAAATSARPAGGPAGMASHPGTRNKATFLVVAKVNF
jgi:hypothetical protein